MPLHASMEIRPPVFFNWILLHLKTTFPNYSTSFDITFKIGSWQLEGAYALQYPETPPGICVS